ncbi:hypothetical protein AAF712_009898 [Marasmius tenuissimus]|uniref:Uncharacterized protein n=1 Tax=Marasmius tenuissimus TaxID=585030 RepID=A0ABR2ZPP8_9AGAR
MSRQNAIADANIVEEFETNHWTWHIALAGLLVVMTVMYKYCRATLYPCLTPAELKSALQRLQTVQHSNYTVDLTVSAVLDGMGGLNIVAPEWNRIEDDYLDLNIAASKILEKHLQESIWWTYAGFNLELMPEIARWYDQSEELTRRILQAHERDKRSRFEAERNRRQAIRQPSTLHISSAYESPYRFTMDDNRTYSFTPEVNLPRGLSATSGARTRRIYPNGGVDSHIE